ncbi:hypothetical protein [Streptobacillus notomytis]|uniref:hypothetical protein n=1 Tax=Streptobacillus notomytis TaxID=1712031 RepID=UPI00093611A4|nr:hypothetical protein [Streptobacillus notomytis]
MINIRPVFHFTFNDDIEKKLDEADTFAENSSTRLSKSEIFSKVRKKINEWEKIKDNIFTF